MKLALKILTALLASVLLLVGLGAFWYFESRQPQRDGELALKGLSAAVTVRYDERGVPHLQANNEIDLYRALGFVQAQDRLFQMEIMRRLAKGELAEILGPDLVKTDTLFRTLRLGQRAATMVEKMDPQSPAVRAQSAYLDGINQFLANNPAPVEFDLLGIPKRAFTLQDSMAVAGYLAYSFAAAFKTEPVLTFVRDRLGPDYLRMFELEWNPLGVVSTTAKSNTARTEPDWNALNQIAQISAEVQDRSGVALYEGSNAWAVSGTRTSSGKPMLAGDPHIGFSVPSVWYEAHLKAPGFELYGHFQALLSTAMLGHNPQFGWSLTMFQNDDLDLIVEKVNPRNANQVWVQGQWVDLQTSQEIIKVKGTMPVKLTLQRSPHGPIITRAFTQELNYASADAPVAMWWTFLETDNPLLEAFYQLNRADTLVKARQAASNIHAPGLNVVWASASGDIGWWAAARLPIRPAGTQPHFMLSGDDEQADKLGFYRFNDNPQEENPARGYIVSANHQPHSTSGLPIPGYYNPYDRAQALQDRLGNNAIQWNALNSQSLQLSTQTGYFWRVLEPLLPDLSDVVREPLERSVFDSLVQWDGQYSVLNIPPTVFTQFIYELANAALGDELGSNQFKTLLGTRALDLALPRLAADETSPWWDNAKTPKTETRKDIVRIAWNATIAHLKATLGKSPNDWGWGKAHTLTHKHPLGSQALLGKLFNVGPFEAPGAREVPNNQAYPLGPAPWAVTYGPSTRRIIDFADPAQARGINPVGQSGVLFSRHYSDQAAAYMAGGYMQMYLSEADVNANARTTLSLKPAAK
ncbi:MAG: penicillin acylase family protein [Rhodoferax sp.]|nr:penicillin acylase family protein [Rhodoferax sp.]